MNIIGVCIAFFGLGSMLFEISKSRSIALISCDTEFVLFFWIDSWGTDIGWKIRGLLVVVGMLMTARIKEDEEI